MITTSPSSPSLLLLVGTAITASLATLAIQNLLEKRRRQTQRAPKRCAGAIKIKPDKYDQYTQLHDYPWKEVLDRMYKSNIRNFTIHYHKETNTLFHHFDWIGGKNLDSKKEIDALFEADMNAIAQDPATREWWGYCEPCQVPFAQWPKGELPHSQQPVVVGQPPKGDWWAPLACVNHCGHWPVDYSSQQRDPEFAPMHPNGLTSSRKNPPQSPLDTI